MLFPKFEVLGQRHIRRGLVRRMELQASDLPQRRFLAASGQKSEMVTNGQLDHFRMATIQKRIPT